MGVKTFLIEIFKRPVTVDETLKIFKNGELNDYPERQERYINNSVTAKSSAGTMANYIAGLGFGDEANKIKVNNTNSLLILTHKTARSIARQRGGFIHVNYNLDFDIDYIDVLPYSHCRKGKGDDNNYSGKILVSPDWTKTDEEKNKPTEFDVYNPKKQIVRSQINAAKGETLEEKIANYKGQVLFIELDGEEEYPLSTIDAVQFDCDSEAQASIYKNRGLRKGFFGKTLVVTPPMVDIKATDEESAKELTEQEGEREAFRKAIKGFIGPENNEGVLHMELELDGAEDLDKVILFKNIEANINDKVFAHTETTVSNNIRYAFNNIPALLIKDSIGNLFGTSGEAIKEAKKYYQEQTNMERSVLVSLLTGLLKKHVNFKDMTLTHEPLVKVEPTVTTKEGKPTKEKKTSEGASSETEKAQAGLRGSVGGVNGILGIQTSVTEGKTDRQSAITILEEIYGFDTEVANALLGEVVEKPIKE